LQGEIDSLLYVENVTQHLGVVITVVTLHVICQVLTAEVVPTNSVSVLGKTEGSMSRDGPHWYVPSPNLKLAGAVMVLAFWF
jgi:hypothetical protein